MTDPALKPETSRRKFRAGCILAAIAASLWGASAVVGRALFGTALDSCDPMTVNFYRFLLGTLVLNLYLAATGRFGEVVRAFRTDWKMMCLAGLFGVTMEGSFQLWSLTWTTAGRSALFGGTSPLFTMILAVLFLREKAGLLRWIGVAAASAGTVMLFFSSGGDLIGTEKMWIGDVLALCSAISWALYTVITSKAVEKYDGLVSTAIMLPVGTLTLLPMAAFRGGFAIPVTWETSLGILYLGAFACGIAYLCWAQAGKYLPAGVLGAFGYFNLVAALVLSILFLREEVSLMMAASLIVILIGSILMVKREKK